MGSISTDEVTLRDVIYDAYTTAEDAGWFTGDEGKRF